MKHNDNTIKMKSFIVVAALVATASAAIDCGIPQVSRYLALGECYYLFLLCQCCN